MNAEIARQRHEELIRDAERRSALLGGVRRGRRPDVSGSAAQPVTGGLRRLARLSRLLPAR